MDWVDRNVDVPDALHPRLLERLNSRLRHVCFGSRLCENAIDDTIFLGIGRRIRWRALSLAMTVAAGRSRPTLLMRLLDEDVTRKRFGAQAIDDPDIGEERACHSASLGISQKARRRIAQ